MLLDKILESLFPSGHTVLVACGLIFGRGALADGDSIAVIGVDGRIPIGVDEAALLSGHVLDVIKSGGNEPILILIDSDSQRMSKRDELLGLNEFLAHLAKCLILANKLGHRTIGLLYGHTAAGAFIATALATQTLLALPGAEPAVMDLPSMSRVTKLSIEVLQEKAKSTPVFAPGLDNLAQTGAVAITLDPDRSLAHQLTSVLSQPVEREDSRDKLGKERNGRPKAADIAKRVYELARASV
ncbi:biotin-independent malonate decarboxylase subunit gamma [Dyella dinghuensis]|uniref:Biotin-independent malonate decarboxylase subunit gamma n=1 Tax=Dyella dinghuensis TaxID=1920169 RepID=A0A3S0WQ26_9GAMM|nr:biotin-independent malonate decarboxylase subunit gamma [Dyella dinghuensis]RUL65743.1 biotin-independent malonate decarboxylase subunit gamma [Dyella dinghuensis]